MKIILPAAALAAASLSPFALAAPTPAALTGAVAAPRYNPFLAHAKSFSVTETVTRPDTHGKMVVVAQMKMQFQDADKCYIETQTRNGPVMERETVISDGSQRYLYAPAEAQYIKAAVDANAATRERLQIEALPLGKPVRTLLAGKPSLLFQQVRPSAGRPDAVLKIWVDAKTSLLQHISHTDLTGKQPKVVEQIDFTGWKINPAIPPSRFSFTPPAGAKEVVADVPPAEPALLANGTVAPDFAVQDPTGKTVHLSDYKGKVVVLDFWATWCGPCQQSLPHTQSIAAQFAPQGVVVLAVNVWDTKPAFDKWVPAHAALRNIAFAFDPSPDAKQVTDAYNVSGIPTQYVIGKDGKITHSVVGYDGPSGDLANAVTSALKGTL